MTDDDDLWSWQNPSADGGKLERAFWEFHRANPHVYAELARLAREWVARTGGKLGIAMLFERARWELALQTRGGVFRLNNNHRAFYARLLMQREPDLAASFDLRRQKLQASIGPDNDDLPPGEHIS